MKKIIITCIIVSVTLILASCEGSNSSISPIEVGPDSDCTDCGVNDPTIENGTNLANRLELEALAEQGSSTLTLTYSKANDSQGPRVAELRLSLSPDLTFVSAKAGSALTEAGKELISQVEEDGVIRLVALSGSSVSEIGSGVLATVQVTRSGNGLSTAELLLDRPLFAPAQANDGLLVDGKVTF